MKQWNLYTSKEIKPRGWLKRQLEIQAEGLSGNLDKVWRDVRDSAWIGGDAEGWERVPYWLDGFIPLAYLLENEDMIARAKKYIDAIIERQKPSGWICPCADEEIPTYDTWALLLISKVFVVYYDCSGDERIPGVLYKTLKNLYDLMVSGQSKLIVWGEMRWFEGFIAINFVYDRCHEEWLKELASLLKKQGGDYSEYTSKWHKPLNKWTHETHIVNLTMMLKAEAVSHEILGEDYRDQAEEFYEILNKYNGTPVGLFTGDECLSGLSPIQGTELCSVAEQMYSYELLYACTGDKKWAERLEVIAFNALPATISDDMWTHQYVQMSNQISCEKFPRNPIFRTNRSDAHLFGLEPNFGCCTANFNQAWPKFALSSFMEKDGTVINTLPVPSELTTDFAVISLETNYPFENSFKYRIKAEKSFSFKVRVPSFAENIKINGEKAEKTDMLEFAVEKGEREITLSFDAKVRLIDRPHNLKTVRYGSLIFSLPVKYEKKMYEYIENGVERKFPYCDYEYIGTSDWNYGYCSEDFEVVRGEIGDIPFSSENPPITIKTKAVKINWGLEEGFEKLCAKVPESRVPISEAEDVTLYPYGAAKLRMTEMPFIKKTFSIEKTHLSTYNTNGYEEYRIPGIACTSKDTIIVHCEARSNNTDWGKIEIIYWRSTDHGKTWEGPKVLTESPDGRTVNCANMIVDGDIIHYIHSEFRNRMFYSRSVDDGVTWSEPVEITDVLHGFDDRLSWHCCFACPSHGIKMSSGRLVMPLWLGVNPEQVYECDSSHTGVIYSDDHGETWHAGGIIVNDPIVNSGETSIAECTDGSLYINTRHGTKIETLPDGSVNINNIKGDVVPYRAVSYSRDGGESFEPLFFDKQHTDPNCSGGIVAYNGKLYFVNCDHLPTYWDDRCNLTIKRSEDNGKTWEKLLQIEEKAGYADLVVDSKGTIYCFYESGRVKDEDSSFPQLHLTVAKLENITD